MTRRRNTKDCEFLTALFLRWLIWAMVIVVSAQVAGAASYESSGQNFTMIPLVNFSSDDGTGYGLRVSLFEYDGVSRPYRKTYSAQAFFTTKGKWVHRFYMDMPHLRPGHRVEIEALYEKEDFANYYGGLSESVLDTYTKAQKTFQQNHPKLRVMWIRDLRLPWRLRTEFRTGRNRIRPNATAGSILSDIAPPGADGATLFHTTVALQYDTRDDYVNSTKGVFEEFLVEYGLGSGFSGGKMTYEHRHFFSPVPVFTLAHRLHVGLTFGDVPFYEAFPLGGSSVLRGAPAARWRDSGRILLNGELRWRGLILSDQYNIRLGMLAFGDVGQVFNRSEVPSTDDWHVGAGAGLRFYWHSTVLRADYGISGKNRGIYLTFSHVF